MLMGKIFLAYLNKLGKLILIIFMISSFFAILCGKNQFFGRKSPKNLTNDRLRGGKISDLELTLPSKDFLVFSAKHCHTKRQNMVK